MGCIIDSLKINYEVIGHGKPIVLIHGFAVDHRLMKGCMEPIFNKIGNFKRIYIDLPGMGYSECNNKINNSDDMLDIICKFIDIIIPKQEYLLVGESYGGYLSRGITYKNPDLVKGLILICPTIIPEREKRILPPHTNIECDTEFIKSLSDRDLKKFQDSNVILNKEVYSRYINEIVAGIKLSNKDLLRRVRKNFGFSFDLNSLLKFNNPTLFIVGRQDSVVGYIDAFNILNNFPRADYMVIDGAGHNMQIERPDLFSDIVKRWLLSNF